MRVEPVLLRSARWPSPGLLERAQRPSGGSRYVPCRRLCHLRPARKAPRLDNACSVGLAWTFAATAPCGRPLSKEASECVLRESPPQLVLASFRRDISSCVSGAGCEGKPLVRDCCGQLFGLLERRNRDHINREFFEDSDQRPAVFEISGCHQNIPFL